jgi:hypothetical protein
MSGPQSTEQMALLAKLGQPGREGDALRRALEGVVKLGITDAQTKSAVAAVTGNGNGVAGRLVPLAASDPRALFNMGYYGEKMYKMWRVIQIFPVLLWQLGVTAMWICEVYKTDDSHFYSKETWYAVSMAAMITWGVELLISLFLWMQIKEDNDKDNQLHPINEYEPLALILSSTLASVSFYMFYALTHNTYTQIELHTKFVHGYWFSFAAALVVTTSTFQMAIQIPYNIFTLVVSQKK